MESAFDEMHPANITLNKEVVQNVDPLVNGV